MADIAKLHIPWLIYCAKRGNSAPLIDYLRGGVEVTPELALLIADILEGKVKAKPKRPKLIDYLRRTPNDLKSTVEWLREQIKRGDRDKHFLQALRNAGYKKPYPETKGEITKAAELLAAAMRRLTPAQLDEIIRPRKARAKKTT